MLIHRTTSMLLVLAWLALALGCGGGGSVPEIPDSAEGTVKAVSAGLAKNQPQVIWAAAPASYQKDINELVHLFATKMDGEVWNRTVGTAQKAVNLLGSKKSMILGSKMLAQMDQVDMKKVEAEWNNVVGMLETALDSDLASLDKMKTMDVGAFLADTGATLMAQVEAAASAAKEDAYQKEFKAKVSDVKVKVVSAEGDKATLEITPQGERTEKVDWIKVEGKWVPEEMAQEWSDKMADAKKQIEAMDVRFSDKDKKEFLSILEMVDKTLDKLDTAKNQGEFDAALGQLVGGMMGGMMGGRRPSRMPEGMKAPR